MKLDTSSDDSKRLYPVFLDLAGRRCVIVGGGRLASERARQFVDAGAEVRLIARELVPDLLEIVEEGQALWYPRSFRPGDLEGAFLAAADPRSDVDVEAVVSEADAHGIPLNVIDDPEHCSFYCGSVVRRGDLVVSISTTGRAPAIAVRLRERLERELPHELAGLLDLARSVREPLVARFAGFHERRQLWYRWADSGVLDLLRAGEDERARRVTGALFGLECPTAVADPPAGVVS